MSSARQRSVLATLLLSCDRVVSVDSLTEAVWQGDPPATARNQIAICITSLRRTFREASVPVEMIETSHPGYILHSAHCYIDLKDLNQSVAKARMVAAHNEQAAEATKLYEHALALWRGPALDGLSGAHIDDISGQLAEFRLDVCEEYAALQLRLGHHHKVSHQLVALVKENPLREQARAHLMQAHHMAGRRADALQVYRAGRQALVEELGIEPGPVLREAHRRILQNADDSGPRPRPCPEQPRPAGTATEAPTPPAPPSGPAPGVPAQLPLALSTFTGRETEIEALDALLRDSADGSAPAVAVITGVSGIGKSALIVHWANRIADRFPDGQLFIDVHGYHKSNRPLSSLSVLDQALRGLGVSSAQIPAGVQERSALYRSLLNHRKLLVILDDVRSFLQIQPLLPGRGRCLVLITSRDPLDELVSDYGAVQLQLNVMTTHEANRMLATVIGPDRVAAEPEAAARIAELCGHLPLALRIAAGRLTPRPYRSLQRLAARLEDGAGRLDVLSPSDGGVRAGFWLSYRELSPDAATLFRRLALLPVEGFAAWAGAAVLDVDLMKAEDLIEQLVDAQLLELCMTQTGPSARFRFHELLRLFAWERVHEEDSAEERADALERAYGTLLTLAGSAHQLLYGAGHLPRHSARLALELPADAVAELLADPLEWFEAERGTILAMVGAAAQHDATAHAWELTARTMPLFEMRNYQENWQQAAQSALESARLAGDTFGATVMLRSLGSLAIYQRRYQDADGLLTSAMELLDEVDDPHERAVVLRNLALCARFRGDLDGAATHCRAALARFRETDDPVSAAHALGLLAQIELERGETDTGIALTRQAITASTETGSVLGRAQNVYRLAEAYLRIGDLREVIGTCNEVIELTRAQGDRLGEAYALRALGEAQWRQEAYDAAESTLGEAFTAAEDIGDRFLQARIETDRACSEALRGGASAGDRLRRAQQAFVALSASSWQARAARLAEVVDAAAGLPVPLERLLATR
ncbi:BTAD domain-containing putative transcriptional regulator [Streptomyces sp. CSDS2]|uniref:AfsR/SARP family transcriptional regulator n=1 Tax=Streptomyces sp. CSDS2 TaxID=3055051 RepID=UPI0025AF3990|nr:BTAD domain-containing putative transcriptional regulator [Streptomyces sp. CSDS2]MDN3262233.1 BTAD domain-containing putative transcriptional regulator [Streptomyces sp. CSDS2]